VRPPPRPVRVGSVFTSMYVAGGDENRYVQQVRGRDPARVDLKLALVLRPEVVVEAHPSTLRRVLAAAGVEPFELAEVPDHARPERSLPLRALRLGWTAERVVRRLARWFVEHHVEVVDAHLSVGTALCVLAARLAGGLPVVATTYGPAHFTRPGYAAIGRAVYAGVDTFVSDAAPKLDEVESFMGRALRTAVVPNGLEPPRPSRSAHDVRAELDLPPDALVLGQVARFVPFKGQDRLVDAMPALLARCPSLHLVLAGLVESPDHLEALRARARSLGVAARVRAVPWPGPIGDLWQVVDVHAHPTRFDSSPLAILEAMSLGRPTVATRVGGIAALLDGGACGHLLDAGVDTQGLVDALTPLLVDPDRRRALGARAQARWSARHTPAQLAAGMEAVYAEVAARHQQRRAA